MGGGAGLSKAIGRLATRAASALTVAGVSRLERRKAGKIPQAGLIPKGSWRLREILRSRTESLIPAAQPHGMGSFGEAKQSSCFWK